MLLLLALVGCADAPTSEDAADVVRPEALEGSLRIATAPERGERRLAPVKQSRLPDGVAVVRDCFGRGEARSSRRNRGGFGTASGRGTGSAAPTSRAVPPAPPATVAAPAPAPSPPARPPKPKQIPPKKMADATTGKDKAAPKGTAEKIATAAPSEDLAMASGDRLAKAKPQRPGGVGEGGDLGGADGMADAANFASAPKAERQQQLRERSDNDALYDDGAAEPTPDMVLDLEDAPADEPMLDWGATVYLSNDDSMSLASAQRMLYAMTQGMGLSPSEVRPHELLNYFSFDTAGAPETQTFSVLGAAEADGETLTVSLAVHGANPPRQPLDLTVLLDRSCSMSGEGRMDYTKRGLSLLGDQLQQGDRLDVVLFESGVCTPLENFVVGRDDPALLANVVEQLAPTGGTDLDAGLQEAFRVQRSRTPGDIHGRNRRVMLITDALLNTGNVDASVVSDVARAYEDDGIRLTGIGVGRDFNDRMLDLLTEKGKGAYVYLGSEAVVDRIFGSGFDSLTRTIAHNVQFSLDLPDSLAMERFYGEESSTNPEDVQPIHYYAGTTQLFLQDLRMREGRPNRSDPIKMRIAYRNARTGEPEVQELHTTVGALLDGDPHNLRKGQALMNFADLVLSDALGADPCGASLEAYQGSAAKLVDDAEIAFVNGLVSRTCNVDLTTVARSGVPLKVRVDADMAIPEVTLDCGGHAHTESLSGSDNVARFASVMPGMCRLELQGNLPLVAAVDVPDNGGELRCVVRGGRVFCQ